MGLTSPKNTRQPAVMPCLMLKYATRSACSESGDVSGGLNALLKYISTTTPAGSHQDTVKLRLHKRILNAAEEASHDYSLLTTAASSSAFIVSLSARLTDQKSSDSVRCVQKLCGGIQVFQRWMEQFSTSLPRCCSPFPYGLVHSTIHCHTL